MRYTVAMDRDIVEYLDRSGLEYKRIYPNVESKPLPKGMFLNAAFTSKFKALQLAELASYYEDDTIKDNDIIFVSDIWFPGLESIAYMNFFCNKKVKLRGFLHAGSMTDTDYVRQMERWAKGFEEAIFDISDKVFVASNFMKNDLIQKRYVDKPKVEVTSLPLDYKLLDKYRNDKPKKNIVIFNGRNCDEKQPWLFDKLKSEFSPDYAEFINTQNMNLSKDEYYKLLSTAKTVVSFALQENFGFGINEAVYLGCTPILPNRLVYPEFYTKELLYDTFDQCVEMVHKTLIGTLKSSSNLYIGAKSNSSIFDQWFKN